MKKSFKKFITTALTVLLLLNVILSKHYITSTGDSTSINTYGIIEDEEIA